MDEPAELTEPDAEILLIKLSGVRIPDVSLENTIFTIQKGLVDVTGPLTFIRMKNQVVG